MADRPTRRTRVCSTCRGARPATAAFDLEHVSARGFGRGETARPPCRWRSSSADRDAIRRRASHRHHAAAVRRVCTRQAAVAATPAETHASADAEATFGLVPEDPGRRRGGRRRGGARASRGLARRSRRRARMRRGSSRRRRRREYKSPFALDASFANARAAAVARLTHAALARPRGRRPRVRVVPAEPHLTERSPRTRRRRVLDAPQARRRARARACPEITAWRADGAFLTSRDDDAAAYASDAVSPGGTPKRAEEEAKSKTNRLLFRDDRPSSSARLATR